jgi:hypothetical protein
MLQTVRALILKYKLPLIAGALLLGLALMINKSCSLYDQNSKLKALVQGKTTQLKQSEEATAKIREAFAKVVVEKDFEIAHWQGIANNNGNQIAAGNDQIRRLREQLAKLNPAEKDAIIVQQAQLIKALENNLTLAYNTIDAKDRIIAAWQVKFDECVVYTTQLEDEIKQHKALEAIQKDLISGLEGKLKIAKFWGNTTKVTTLAALIALGVVVAT